MLSKPLKWQCFLKRTTSHLIASWLHWESPTLEILAVSFLLTEDTCFWCGFVFHSHYLGIYGMPDIQYGIPHNITSNQRTHLLTTEEQKVSPWPTPVIISYTTSPTSPRGCWPGRITSSLLTGSWSIARKQCFFEIIVPTSRVHFTYWTRYLSMVLCSHKVEHMGLEPSDRRYNQIDTPSDTRVFCRFLSPQLWALQDEKHLLSKGTCTHQETQQKSHWSTGYSRPLSTLETFVFRNQQARPGVTILSEVIELEQHEKTTSWCTMKMRGICVAFKTPHEGLLVLLAHMNAVHATSLTRDVYV